MPTPPESIEGIEIEDVEYVRHGSTPLLARTYMPNGPGPFPALVDLHGGAWTRNDRTDKPTVRVRIAKFGIAVVAIDFRMPPGGRYPAALADINYAIRWVKANALRLKTAPELVGVSGSSSGGHLAVLAAMRPADPRYAALPDPPGADKFDASVRCALALWPVISPLGRYQYAKQMRLEGKHKDLTDSVIPGHDEFWVTEEAMAEGDPGLSLERGEDAALQPILAVQSRTDPGHPLAHLERFAALYRGAGGQIDLELLGDDESPNLRDALNNEPDRPSSQRVYARIAEFVQKSVS